MKKPEKKCNTCSSIKFEWVKGECLMSCRKTGWFLREYPEKPSWCPSFVNNYMTKGWVCHTKQTLGQYFSEV